MSAFSSDAILAKIGKQLACGNWQIHSTLMAQAREFEMDLEREGLKIVPLAGEDT